jgi:2-keto-4-pentenoate hydratase/2-oxohepta-3-ene-1,7-dioic acid hydratase in catechol pathway
MPDGFRLGTFARRGEKPFVGLLLDGDRTVDLRAVHAARAGALTATASLLDILDDWERNFAALQDYAAFVAREGVERFQGAAHDRSALTVRPPILRPPKILNAAANYSGHLKEMRLYTETGMTSGKDKIFAGRTDTARPYLFLKASSALCGAFDDVVLPEGRHQTDWEAELALAIGKAGKRIPAERAMEHVAGFMTFNDVSCRTTLWREDRPNFRSDWLASKSYDTFGPLGPYFVPRAFVPDHAQLRLQLRVNGKTMQDGLAGDMIFSPEDQIEYASRFMTLEPGDIFATGTLAGVGQGSGTFLKPGDIMEAEVVGLGAQRNRVVAAAVA